MSEYQAGEDAEAPALAGLLQEGTLIEVPDPEVVAVGRLVAGDEVVAYGLAMHNESIHVDEEKKKAINSMPSIDIL